MTSKDLMVNNVVLLVSEGARGIILGSQFAYIRELMGRPTSADDDESTLRLITAAAAIFSAGRLLANIALGILSDKWCYRTVLVLALLVQAAGQFGYSMAAYSNVYVLLATRFVIGFGSGVLATCRAFVGAIVPPEQKTRQFSYLGTAKFFGYAITPALALAFPSELRVKSWTICSHALPGYIMCVTCLATAAACWFMMSNVRAPPTKQQQSPPSLSPLRERLMSHQQANPRALSQTVTQWLRHCNRFCDPYVLGSAIFICLNLTSKGVLTLMEATLGPQFESVFPDDDDKLEQDTQWFFLFLGLGGLVVYIGMALKPSASSDASDMSEQSSLAPQQQTFIRRVWQSCTSHAKQWDVYLLIASQVITAVGSSILMIRDGGDSLVRVIVAAVLVRSLAAPMADTLAVSLFSAVVTDSGGRQGKMMAWISGAGSVGRIVFPLLTEVEPTKAVFGCAAGASLLCALSMWLYNQRANATINAQFGKDASDAVSLHTSALEADVNISYILIPADESVI
jgi:MFS family permease